MDNQKMKQIHAAGIAVIVLLVILLLVCMYDNTKKEKFGAQADPRALAEEGGLRMLGWEPDFRGGNREAPSGCAASGACGGPPTPGAFAEDAALRHLSWRPAGGEGFTGGCNLRPHPAAAAEAGGLQAASGLRASAPYYQEGFASGESSEAMTSALAHRNISAINQIKSAQLAASPGAPYRVSARQARHDSVREGFGGPGLGFGWTPTQTDMAGGWAAAQSACAADCRDNCNGSHCSSHCADSCVSATALS